MAVFVLDKHKKPLMPCPQGSLCFTKAFVSVDEHVFTNCIHLPYVLLTVWSKRVWLMGLG